MRRLPRFFSRIGVRLMAFNALLVFLPAAGVLFLDTYEQRLLADQERSMVLQGRVLAAALSGRGELRRTDVVHTLLQLGQRSEARFRVVDRSGRTLADSSLLGPRRDAGVSLSVSQPSARESPLYGLGAVPIRVYRWLLAPPEPPLESADVYASGQALGGPEIVAALAGRYGAATRMSSGGQRSVTLYSAIPIRDRERVMGAVLVSQSTYRILQALYDVRIGVFQVFLASLAAAIVLSLLVSTTIAQPLVRLRNQAEALLDRRGRLRGRFHALARSDEIGDLARALERLTHRLEEHLRFVESFASDVSHEFKNPLASIRTATEMLSEVDDPAERKRFLGVVLREVARTEHLLSEVREITRLDAGAGAEESERIELRALVDGLVEAYRMRGFERFDVLPDAGPLVVSGSPERLTRVFENVIDNAVSFSPPGGRIEIRLGRDHGDALVCVGDHGAGIPASHLGRVFDRFFSYRPERAAGDGEHTGLGLAIARAIVESAGGKVRAANRESGGASLEIRLPLQDVSA